MGIIVPILQIKKQIKSWNDFSKVTQQSHISNPNLSSAMTCAFNYYTLLPGKRLMGYLSQAYKHFNYIPKEWLCTKLATEMFLSRRLFLAEPMSKSLLPEPWFLQL